MFRQNGRRHQKLASQITPMFGNKPGLQHESEHYNHGPRCIVGQLGSLVVKASTCHVEGPGSILCMV